MKLIAIYVTGIAVGLGGYWLAKHGSYWLWYEDMVKATIVEMVKGAALR